MSSIPATRVHSHPGPESKRDPPGKRYFFGWGTASKKTQGPALDFGALEPIDAVLLSHDHHDDNFDPTARELLPRMGTVITTAPGAKRLGGAARGLAAWESTRLEAEGKTPIEIQATPCHHGPPGSKPIVGEVVGFALTPEDAPTLWLSGDTVLYAGVREVADKVDVDVAVMHLGGVTFPWLSGGLRYTLNAREAVELAELIDPRVIVPLHYEGWKHFREPRCHARDVPDASAVADRVRWIDHGGTLDLAT